MADRFSQPPGITQGDIGPRYVRKRLADEVYIGHYIKAGDRIRIRSTVATGVIASLTTVNLTIGGRVQGMDGELVPFGDSFTFSADGVQTAQYVMAPEGYVVDLIVQSTSTGLTSGDLTVVVDIVQGIESSAVAVGLLAFGYIYPAGLLGLNVPRNIGGGSGGGMAIGGTVTSGTTPDILYVGAGPVLAQDANLQWDATNKQIKIEGVGLAKIFSKKIPIPHAAILTLPTALVDLVAAPGATNLLWPMYSWLVPSYTANYTNVGAANTCIIELGYNNGGSMVELANLLTAGGLIFEPPGANEVGDIPPNIKVDNTQSTFGSGVAYNLTSNGVNKSLSLSVTNSALGNFTGGNVANVLNVYLQYAIIPVN